MGLAKDLPAKYGLCTHIVENMHTNRQGIATCAAI